MFENKYNSFMEFYGDVCDDPRDPIERKLAVMKKKNICFGGGKGSAPDTNPGMLASAAAAKEIAAEQAAVARESLAFYKQQYEEFKPVLNEIMQGEVDMQKANKARADEYAAYEKETYRPLEQELVRKAKEYNTEAKREQLATAGAADVSQAFGVSRGQMQRQQSAAGIAPNSGRFAALNQQMMTQEALARAGAMNNARTMAEDRGNALMYDAAGLGRNLATNASTAYGVSQNAAAGAKQSAQTGGAMMGQGYNSFNQGMSGANNAYVAPQVLLQVCTLAVSLVRQTEDQLSEVFMSVPVMYLDRVVLLMIRFQQCYLMASTFFQQIQFKRLVARN